MKTHLTQWILDIWNALYKHTGVNSHAKCTYKDVGKYERLNLLRKLGCGIEVLQYERLNLLKKVGFGMGTTD